MPRRSDRCRSAGSTGECGCLLRTAFSSARGLAYGTPLREFVRVIILVASPISAIVCNVIRLVPTIWMFGNLDKEIAEGFHDISGWVMLPLAFLILLGIVRLMRWALIPVYRYSLAYGT